MGAFLSNYLQNRQFQVTIGGNRSSTFTETNGVPQGSALAVTLFLIAMNPVFRNITSKLHILVYADDIILVSTGKNLKFIRRKIQTAVKKIGQWANAVRFFIAPHKCAIAHCCNSHHVVAGNPIKLDNINIPFQRLPKILGITIDRKLTFNNHFKNIKKDCESRLRFIKTISSCHPRWNRRTALNISKALNNSRIFYGIEITCLNREGMQKTLAPLYNRSIRLASNLLPSTPVFAACVQSGVLPFQWYANITIFKRTLGFLQRTRGNNRILLSIAKNLYLMYNNTRMPKLARIQQIRRRNWFTKIPRIDTIFSAEASAILYAIKSKPPNTPTIIPSDSLAVLAALEAGNSLHPFIQAIEEQFNNQTVFCWIPGHSGIPGNEEADALAALGRSNNHYFTRTVPAMDLIISSIQKPYTTSSEPGEHPLGTPKKLKVNPINGSIEAAGWSNGPYPDCEPATPEAPMHTSFQIVNHHPAPYATHHSLPSSIREVLNNNPDNEHALLKLLRDANLLECL
ncbi:uncharacterized protein LOC131428920 [Malaya genurostris]|uniref:uncharacterized protein LOC131428920 n=1 Tax=Malaya genurostris TaxID=325434 RepID=UPI0026F37EB9|nr:uncharacterized protein LOC131428920 [Malaya genurostris]